MPNDRQFAILIWLAVAAAILFTKRDFRVKISRLLTLLVGPKISVPLFLMTGYVAGLVLLGKRVGVWSLGLITDTVFWFAGSASVLFFQLNRAANEERFFRRVALATVEVTVFLEFLVNISVFSLPVELALQPVVFLLVVTATYAAIKPKYLQVKRLLDFLLGTLGVVLIAVVVVQLIDQREELDLTAQGLALALPIWLTLGLLPFLALASFWVSLDHIYVHVDAEAPNWRYTLRGMLAVVLTVGPRPKHLRAFVGYWLRQLGSAETFRDARSVATDFLEQRRKDERAKERRQQLLKEYEGSTETDDDGRRLDRRGFDDAKKSLMTLASFQAGHFKRAGVYANRLEDILPQSMAHLVEVEPAQIVVNTNSGRDEYWMYAGTPANFFFGVAGRNGDHPAWLYAGETPPTGGIDADDWRHVVHDPAHVEW